MYCFRDWEGIEVPNILKCYQEAQIAPLQKLHSTSEVTLLVGLKVDDIHSLRNNNILWIDIASSSQTNPQTLFENLGCLKDPRLSLFFHHHPLQLILYNPSPPVWILKVFEQWATRDLLSGTWFEGKCLKDPHFRGMITILYGVLLQGSFSTSSICQQVGTVTGVMSDGDWGHNWAVASAPLMPWLSNQLLNSWPGGIGCCLNLRR